MYSSDLSSFILLCLSDRGFVTVEATNNHFCCDKTLENNFTYCQNFFLPSFKATQDSFVTVYFCQLEIIFQNFELVNFVDFVALQNGKQVLITTCNT